MALTPTFSTGGGDFETAEEGKYLCTIANVTREDRASFDDPNVLEPNFVWDFETVKETDSKGRPYKFRHFTKTAYGNEKAKLTHLINGLFGRAFVQDQVNQFDFEKLIGKPCGVMVGLTPSNKNKVLSVKCLTNKPLNVDEILKDGADKRLAPPAPADAEDDPFADN